MIVKIKNVIIDKEFLLKVLTQCLPYIGYPRSLNALACIKKVCERIFFNKELDEMTDYECILLAGIPNAPSVYAPTKNPDLAKQRQRQVMEKMIENKFLTEDEANEILKQAE